ncbi:MAG: type II secretion system protein M [Pseudomonadales bacterium]
MANQFRVVVGQLRRQFRQARHRYDGLERRERVTLNLLACFIGILLLYYGAWVPSNAFLESRIADRDRQLSVLRYMRATEAKARAAGSTSVPAPFGQSLLSEVSRSALEFNINPNRLQPEGTGGVSVWFDGVVFDDLMLWLQEQSAQGIYVQQVSIDRQAAAGKVNARIVLRN